MSKKKTDRGASIAPPFRFNPNPPAEAGDPEGDYPRPIFVDLNRRLRAFDPAGVEVVEQTDWETCLPANLEARPGEELDEDLEATTLRLRERRGRRFRICVLRTGDGTKLVGCRREFEQEDGRDPVVEYAPHPRDRHLPAFRETADPAGASPRADGVVGPTPPAAYGAEISFGDLLRPNVPDPGSHPDLGRLYAIARAEGRKQFGPGTIRLLRAHLERLLRQVYGMEVGTRYVDGLMIDEAAEVLEAAIRREVGRLWNPTPEKCENCRETDLDIWDRALGLCRCHECRTGRRLPPPVGVNHTAAGARPHETLDALTDARREEAAGAITPAMPQSDDAPAPPAPTDAPAPEPARHGMVPAASEADAGKRSATVPDENPIPQERRSRPMTIKEAAEFYGFKGKGRGPEKQMAAAIRSGAISRH